MRRRKGRKNCRRLKCGQKEKIKHRKETPPGDDMHPAGFYINLFTALFFAAERINKPEHELAVIVRECGDVRRADVPVGEYRVA